MSSKPVPMLPDEPHFTIADIATVLNVSENTARRLFIDEPGIIKIGHGGTRYKRRHFVLRIPQSVYERVKLRLMHKGPASVLPSPGGGRDLRAAG